MRPAERQQLDGNELSLLGRTDQLCRQPRRRRISGDDRLLRTLQPLQGVSPAMYSISLHRHLPCHPVLFLHHHPGVEGARGIRHQGAGDIGQSRFRAGVSRPDEHAGMDADFSALALAVCDLYQRWRRGGAGPGLDRRPHPLHDSAIRKPPRSAARALDSGRSRPAFSGSARWAPSSGGSFMRECRSLRASSMKQSRHASRLG